MFNYTDIVLIRLFLKELKEVKQEELKTEKVEVVRLRLGKEISNLEEIIQKTKSY